MFYNNFQIRNIGTTMCTTTVSIFSFTMLKSFPYLLFHLGLHGCMLVFVCVGVLGIIFVVFVVPETKGKDLNVLNSI